MVCQGIWTRRWSRKFTVKTTYQWARRLDLGCTVMLHNLWFENQMRNKVVQRSEVSFCVEVFLHDKQSDQEIE